MNWKSKYLLSMLVAFVFFFAASTSRACSPSGLLPMGLSWAPNALVGISDVGVPTADAVPVANWNNAFAAAGFCNPPYLAFNVAAGLSLSYEAIPNQPCPTNPALTCSTRGLATMSTSSTSYLTFADIKINNQITVVAAFEEVVAHEIGHTFGLKDCLGCAINSTVMESDPPGGPYNINAVVGTPGPTGCDLSQVILKSPSYTCQTFCDVQPKDCPGGFWSPDTCRCVYPNSPIIIDVSGKGFDLTSAANGVKFDISGTGNPIQIGWIAQGADNAFLALPGADGLVHNGKQLFGNYTPQPTSTTPNGFAALAVYDDPKNGGNGDGVIDSRDAVFASLRLWIDANHDGISQAEELHTLPSLGVDSISLYYHESKRRDEFGNLFRYRSKVNPDDPDISHVGKTAYDVFFVTVNPTPTAKNTLSPDGSKCQVPAKKVGMLAAGVGK